MGYEQWVLNNVGYVMNMRWLISKWHGVGMRWNAIIMVQDGWAGMVFNMKYVNEEFGYAGWHESLVHDNG